MNSWLIPCNPKLYDVCAAFQNFAVIDWKQSMKNVEIGDTIFIYVGAPIQAVLFKCRVVAVNKPFSTIDDSKFVISGERYHVSTKNGDSPRLGQGSSGKNHYTPVFFDPVLPKGK